MSVTYRVAEQFVSINGEGTRAGELAVFVRLCGCNLQCSYCDTQWANQPDVSYQLQTTEEIVQAILETSLFCLADAKIEPAENRCSHQMLRS